MTPTRRAAAYLPLLLLSLACGFAPEANDDSDEEVPEWLREAAEEAAPSVAAYSWVNPPPAGAREMRAVVNMANGLPNVQNGTECHIWVHPQGAGEMCPANVECGGQVLWNIRAGSVCPCTQNGAHLSGGEDQTTSSDGDGAFRFDTATGAVAIRDDADGPLGAFLVSAVIQP